MTSSSLLDDPQAWSLVLQWASDKVEFPQLVELLTHTFGDRYISAEWQDLFNQVFLFFDPGEDIEDADRASMAIAAVEAAMVARGVTIAQADPSAAQPSTAEGKGKRKATNSPRRSRPKKRFHSLAVNSFLDIEAQVDTEDDMSEDEEDSEPFVIADDADLDTATEHAAFRPTRIYPISEHAGPSTFQVTVDKIARRLMPSSLDDLDDAEYNRLYDEFYGIPQDENQEGECGDEGMKLLDEPGIWGAIQEWLYGTLNYPTLLELINFQYDHHPKIQYWEEFLSRLTFIQLLDERKSLFHSISLADHLARISAYRSPPEISSNLSHFSPPPTTGLPVVEARECMDVWAVNILPHSSVEYIVNAWKNASIRSATHKLLPGRVTVHAAYPNVFLHAVPSSHRSCIRGWSLIPVEDRIWQPSSEGPTPSVPGWYSVSKRGIYKEDIAYAISFDRDSAELDVLVVPRRITPRNPPMDALGRAHNARTLFSPDIHHGRPRSPYRGLPRHEHSANVFISGLLLMKLKTNQFRQVSVPSPSQISLHAASMVDPQFIKATHRKYNRLFWNAGDRVTISDPSLGDTWGSLISIDIENQCAVVCLPDDSEYELPLSSLRRLHRVGDVVRVLTDPFSHSGYVHHQNLGRTGIICDIDPLLDDITIQDPSASQFRVPGFLLESHTPDQPVYAPLGVLASSTAENRDDVQIGDIVDLRGGCDRGYNRGYVTEVRRADGTLTFVSTEHDRVGQRFEVPISAVHFIPDPRAMKFTPDRGYNVKPGDLVFVVRGDHRGKTGTVSQVSLEEKSLVISYHPGPQDPQVSITVPIIHCAQAYGRDENNAHREKEVLIISGPNKGWRGSLVSCGPATCVVARGGRILETYNKSQVVVQGLASTLSGNRLTPLQVLQVSNAFARAVIPDTSERVKTPPPDSEPQPDPAGTASSNPWIIDESEREELNNNRPKLAVHEFMLHPHVIKSLETVRAVFQISPGWKDTYTRRLAKTETPTPFETASGPVPPGHLAARLTSRTKGAKLLQEIIPETSLEIYRPVKKNTLCMVVKGVEGGEPIGSILSVLKVSANEQRVHVRRLDCTPASEASLSFDRVIVVEAPA